LVAAVLAFSVATYIISKNPKSWAYKLFFLFGVSVGIWEIMMFLHRNAPTRDLSLDFLASGVFFVYLAPGFLLAALFMLHKEKMVNMVVLIPALIAGALVVIFKPFDPVETAGFGWSLKPKLVEGALLLAFTWLWHVIGITVAGWVLSKRSKTEILKRTYTLIVYGFIIFYGIGFPVSNLLLFNNPEFPPLGGIFILSIFLVVAYAIYLPTKKVEEVFILRKKYEKPPTMEEFPAVIYIFQMSALSKSLKKFLEDFLESLPGKELGLDLQEFDRFLTETGLNKAVFFKGDKIVLDKDKLYSVDSLKSMDQVLKYVRDKRLTAKVMGSLVALFLDVYKAIRMQSKIAADEWLYNVLREHGKFLSAYDFLSRLPSDIELEYFGRVDRVLSSIRPKKKK
jgi:hypothetical protein